ncbi:MAG: hypothetical protein JST36_03695 [Bacteroidetes bacterium]|nr:hypothetical protein [Bacteroidota bacterium]
MVSTHSSKTIVCLLLLAILFTACNKDVNLNYTCNENCASLKLDLRLVDSSKLADKSYLQQASYDIVLHKQPSGLFSNSTYYFIKSGHVDALGKMNEEFLIDTVLLKSNGIILEVRFTLADDIFMCVAFNTYNVGSYPIGGLVQDYIPVKKYTIQPITIKRTLNDSFETGYLYFNFECKGDKVALTNKTLGATQTLHSKFPLNSITYFRIRKFLKSGEYHDTVDSVLIDGLYNGKTIEY